MYKHCPHHPQPMFLIRMRELSFTPIHNRQNCISVKVKVNFTLYQATKAKRGSRGIAPLFLETRPRSGLQPVRRGAENLAPNWIRSPNRPARSDSLYRLSYSGPPYISVYLNTLMTGSFKLFKRPLPGFLTILTL